MWDSHFNSEGIIFDHDQAMQFVVKETLEQTWERKPGEEPVGDYHCWDEKGGHFVPIEGRGSPWTPGCDGLHALRLIHASERRTGFEPATLNLGRS